MEDFSVCVWGEGCILDTFMVSLPIAWVVCVWCIIIRIRFLELFSQKWYPWGFPFFLISLMLGQWGDQSL